jgi:hypothetical protein
MVGGGTLIVLAGLAAGGGYLMSATRQWINEMEVPPSELARPTGGTHPARSVAHDTRIRPAACCGPDLSWAPSIGRLILLVQSPDLYDLHAERLEPGQKPVQGGLVLKRAVHDRLDRFDRGGEPVEVEQRLGRENTGDPDLVVGRWHRGS